MSDTEQTQLPEVVDQAVDTHQKSPKESFAELRKAKEDLERQLWQAQKEKELYERQLQMQAQHSNLNQQQPEEEDFDYNQLINEEFPDGKKLVKAFGTFNKKLSTYEKKLAEKDQKIAALEALNDPSMPDFAKVVTAENIKKYIESDEDNLEGVQKAANPLRKAYNLIKKDARFIADTQTKERPASQEQKRIEEKESKPRVGSVGVRSEAITTAATISNSKMTKEQKNALWAETMAAARK